MAYAFTFNEIDFATLGLYVEKGPNLFMPTMERSAVPVGMGDGEVAGSSRMSGRTIPLNVAIRATSRPDLKSKIDVLAAALNSRDDAQLILDTRTDRFWWARPAGGIDWNAVLTNLGVFRLDFVSGDPAAYAVTPGYSSAVGSGSAFGVTCLVGGNADAFPVITLTLTASHSAWAVGNEARDQKLSWNAPGAALGSGDVVTIECNPWPREGREGLTVSIQRSGDPASTVQNEGVDGKFPELTHGVLTELSNTITAWDVTGTVEVDWRNRWLTG